MQPEVESNWDIVTTSLQDICNSNESLSFNSIHNIDNSSGQDEIEKLYSGLNETDLTKLKEDVNDHKLNIGTAKRLIDTSQENLRKIIDYLQKEEENNKKSKLQESEETDTKPVLNEQLPEEEDDDDEDEENESFKPIAPSKVNKTTSKKNSATSQNQKSKKKQKKVGKSFWQSKYTPSEPVFIGSEVAYKLKNNRFPEEWINCEVLKILGNDGSKFEIRDPEPDENNNPGRVYKATWKEILLIPPKSSWDHLINFAYGTKVLAQYPETTTFYPAIVVGNKKDGNVKLIFDGEEEDNKETEVPRRLVLPYPLK